MCRALARAPISLRPPPPTSARRPSIIAVANPTHLPPPQAPAAQCGGGVPRERRERRGRAGGGGPRGGGQTACFLRREQLPQLHRSVAQVHSCPLPHNLPKPWTSHPAPPHQVLKDLGLPHYHHELVKEALEVGRGGSWGPCMGSRALLGLVRGARSRHPTPPLPDTKTHPRKRGTHAPQPGRLCAPRARDGARGRPAAGPRGARRDQQHAAGPGWFWGVGPGGGIAACGYLCIGGQRRLARPCPRRQPLPKHTDPHPNTHTTPRPHPPPGPRPREGPPR